MNYEYHLCSCKECNDGGYTAVIRVAVDSESKALEWKKAYEERSKVTLRVKTTFPKSGKVNVFKIAYRCQHNTLPRSDTADTKNRTKNTSCPAAVMLTVKRYIEKSK